MIGRPVNRWLNSLPKYWIFVAAVLSVFALAVIASSAVLADEEIPNATPTTDVSENSAIIDNGTVKLGVLDQGHLGVNGTVRAASGTTIVGVRYMPTEGESTSQGCVCEGWGVGDAGTGQAGHTDVAVGGVQNLTVVSFTTSGTPGTGPSSVDSAGDSAVSVVDAFGRLRVTHDFHPTPLTSDLLEVEVTIKNFSSTAVTDLRYTRAMDWDTDPTPFSEFVTIQGIGSAANLLFASDNGFANPNPFAGRGALNAACNNTNCTDVGPQDHGAIFDFGFGPLAPGASKTFRIYYGGAANEAGALAALSAVGAEAYSLGQPNVTGGPNLGIPNTYIFAFSGIGGTVLIPPDLLLEPNTGENVIGDTHTLTATLKDDSGNPVPNVTVTFKIISGPNTGTIGTAATNTAGVATIGYTSSVTGTDTIQATFVDPATGDPGSSNPVTKDWIVPPNLPPTCNAINIGLTEDGGTTSHPLILQCSDPEGQTIQIEIVALSLTSVSPVNVTGGLPVTFTGLDRPEPRPQLQRTWRDLRIPRKGHLRRGQR